MRTSWIVVIALAACRGGGRDAAADRQRIVAEATDAMAALTRESRALSAWAPDAMGAVTSAVLFDPAGGAKRLETDTLPRLDAYLAIADRAVVKADAVAASGTELDAATRATIDQIRRRTAALHGLRDTLAGIDRELAGGPLSQAQIDHVTRELTSASLLLLASE